MLVGIASLFKHPVGGNKAQNPRERLCVRADRSCKLNSGLRRLSQRIRHVQLGKDVNSTRKTISA